MINYKLQIPNHKQYLDSNDQNSKRFGFWIWNLFGICFLLFGIFAPLGVRAATLYFSPSSGNFSVGDILSTSVLVNTQSQAINNASAVINFPASLLEVVSISKSGSIFSLWVEEPFFSNSAGTISFDGGLPTPGFNGTAGKIVSVVFRVKSAGSASVIFSSAAVRANDGYGTDILQSRVQAQFNLVAVGVPPVVPPVERPPRETPAAETPAIIPGAPAAPSINSTTHPEAERWYAENVPEFYWNVPAGVNAVQLLVGRLPNALPTVIYSPPTNERKLGELADGEWYFHVRFRNQYGWGGVTHRKFLIDTVTPKPFTIEVDNGGDNTNPSPILRFRTTDETSGVAYYEIKIGLAEPEQITPEFLRDNVYKIPPQLPGKHTILIKAFDRADNFSLASIDVVIEPIEPPVITDIPTTLQIGDTLTVKGQTDYANSTIILVIKKEGEESQTFELTADGQGGWIYIYPGSLEQGTYQVWAYVIDVRGSQSEPSPKETLTVTLSPILKFGKIAIDYLSVVITLVALVMMLVMTWLYFYYRVIVWRRRIRKETKEAGATVVNAFQNLYAEVEKQIEFLDGKSGLDKDERRVRDRLKKSLDASQKAISKEIKDIEREVK